MLHHNKTHNLVTMEAVQTLAPHQQAEFMKAMEQMQMKDSLG